MEVNNNVISNSQVNETNKVNINNTIKIENTEKNINKEQVSIENNKNSNFKTFDEISKETLDKLIDEVNDKFRLVNKEFSYSIHEKTNRFIVKIKDSESGEILKEIPSEESLDMVAKIMEMTGLLIDEKS